MMELPGLLTEPVRFLKAISRQRPDHWGRGQVIDRARNKIAFTALPVRPGESLLSSRRDFLEFSSVPEGRP